MVCALGWIASSPRAGAPLRLDLLVLVIELLSRARADALVTESRTDEGTRLEFSAHATRQTDFIRELIRAAQRILCAPGGSTPLISGVAPLAAPPPNQMSLTTGAVAGPPDSPGAGLPPGIRERAARRLVEKWRAVSSFDEVWAPGNVTDLAEALGAIAAAPGVPMAVRTDILDALLDAARSIPIIRILGRASAWEPSDREPTPPPADASAFGAKAQEVAERFAGMLQHADYSDPEDQEVLLEAIGRIAGGAFLGASPEEAGAVRRQLVACLFDGTTHGHPRGRRALESLATSPRLPDDLRRAVRERLDGIRGSARA
jgi:hypothetical protein